MAAENYWRYADARQQQQAMVAAAAAAAGMAPAATVTAAQTVGGPAAGMNPQAAAAMAQQAAAPPLKRARPDFGGSCPPYICFTRWPRWWPFDLRVARALWNLGGGF